MKIEPLEKGRWFVESAKGEKRYLVDLAELGGNGKCDCTDFRTRQQSAYDAGQVAHCKHLKFVREAMAEALLQKYIAEIRDDALAPKRDTPYIGLPAKSEKRKIEDQEYRVLREQFLGVNPFCAIYPYMPSEDVHHMQGRGKYLMDVDTWMAVSRKAHIEIHDNPAWAKEQGYLKDRV